MIVLSHGSGVDHVHCNGGGAELVQAVGRQRDCPQKPLHDFRKPIQCILQFIVRNEILSIAKKKQNRLGQGVFRIQGENL